MIRGEYIDYLKILHGSFNAVVGFLFLYQGSLGLRIRRERRAGKQRNAALIGKHRRGGPVFALMGMAGYFAGAVLVFIDKGHLVEYPFHLMTGSGIALLIMTAFIISRKIKGYESPWRTPHFLIGLFILSLYFLQIYIGLNILL
jgi:Protein of unknown function (DUF4079)